MRFAQGAPTRSLLMNTAYFAAPPPGREADFALVPRTALRLSWAILLRPLRGAHRCELLNSGATRNARQDAQDDGGY